MPVIVKPPHDQVVLLDETPLEHDQGIARIGLRLIRVAAIEGRFVHDDKVPVGRGGALEKVDCCHHGRGNAFDRSVGAPCLNRVHGLGPPGYADVLLNPLDYLLRGQLSTLCMDGVPSHQACSRQSHESSSG